jgi:hypothetical protein
MHMSGNGTSRRFANARFASGLELLRKRLRTSAPPPAFHNPPLHSRARAFVQLSRNFAIASSSVAAMPFVTPGVAGTMLCSPRLGHSVIYQKRSVR